MSLLDKLFKRKIEESVSEMEESAQLLKSAEAKLTALRTSDQMLLLSDEILKLVKEYGSMSFNQGRGQQWGLWTKEAEFNELIDTRLKEIKQALKELSKRGKK